MTKLLLTDETVANANQVTTIDDIYTMLVLDNLIAANFIEQQGPTSSDFIQRCIYRQVSYQKASHEIAISPLPSFGTDDLTSMISQIRAQFGIIML